MKQSLLTVGIAMTVMIAWSIGRMQGQQDQSKGKVIFVSADQASFHDMGNGVSMAAIWGDADKGAHATFTKFVPEFDAGTHTHTNDVWIVVLKGAYLYKDEAGDKRVGPVSCEFPVEGSIGAGAIPKRERFSMKNRPVSSIRSL